jgi:hypothetical protein
MPRLRALAVLTAAVAVVGSATASASASAAPSASGSKVLAAVQNAYQTMTRTKYQHKDRENATKGTYYFDCVGLADYFLRLAAPNALADLRAAEGVRTGYVPTPDEFGSYLSAVPASGASLWSTVSGISQVRPGDLIVMDKITNPDTANFVGHAMIAGGKPQRLANGSYSLKVWDSTGTPHGPKDSRLTDPRAIKDKPNASSGSGLGTGTIQIWVGSGGAPQSISWSIGDKPVPTPIEIGRASS